MAETSREIPVEWYVPDEMVGQFANNIVVQHTDSEFILSFFEALPPVIVGTEEERQRQLQAIGSVRARCVARIVIPAPKMENIIGALVTNFTRFTNRQTEHEEVSGKED